MATLIKWQEAIFQDGLCKIAAGYFTLPANPHRMIFAMNRYNFTSSLFFCFLAMASAACHSLLACKIAGHMTIINKSNKELTVDYYVNHVGVKHVHAGSFKLNEQKKKRGHQHDLCWQVDVYDKHLYIDKLDFTAGKQKVTCKVEVDCLGQCTGRVYGCTPKKIINLEGECLSSDEYFKCSLSIR